ncbi:phage holin family protein [Actinocrispum wychmicini]|uniref:Putative superfamily III holin-X n=1 Tax=Actinocrispum wychmicini TaxID=1213861 RepID=A0A4R2K3G5_9PSEU|nr:phage holin family protein [Actinocrispum wychmicini]TCO64299.1 putative superfamily III holin-X [Actinocrispum wychmicini]
MTSAQENDHAAIPSIPLTEDRPELESGEGSIGALVRDATTHLSTLVRAEIELARIEIARDVKRGVRGSIFFMIALTVLLFSLFFFFIAIAELLADVGLPRSASYGIVFAAMLLFAGLAGWLGYKRVRGIKGPRRTISTMRDTAAALRRDGDNTD